METALCYWYATGCKLKWLVIYLLTNTLGTDNAVRILGSCMGQQKFTLHTVQPVVWILNHETATWVVLGVDMLLSPLYLGLTWHGHTPLTHRKRSHFQMSARLSKPTVNYHLLTSTSILRFKISQAFLFGYWCQCYQTSALLSRVGDIRKEYKSLLTGATRCLNQSQHCVTYRGQWLQCNSGLISLDTNSN